jgi:hypothetical protein
MNRYRAISPENVQSFLRIIGIPEVPEGERRETEEKINHQGHKGTRRKKREKSGDTEHRRREKNPN